MDVVAEEPLPILSTKERLRLFESKLTHQPNSTPSPLSPSRPVPKPRLLKKSISASQCVSSHDGHSTSTGIPTANGSAATCSDSKLPSVTTVVQLRNGSNCTRAAVLREQKRRSPTDAIKRRGEIFLAGGGGSVDGCGQKEEATAIKFRAGANGQQMSVGVASRFSQATAATVESGYDELTKENNTRAADSDAR